MGFGWSFGVRDEGEERASARPASLSAEELQREEERHERSAQTVAAINAIVAETGGEEDKQGRIECPRCHLWLSYHTLAEGSVRGRCISPGCLVIDG